MHSSFRPIPPTAAHGPDGRSRTRSEPKMAPAPYTAHRPAPNGGEAKERGWKHQRPLISTPTGPEAAFTPRCSPLGLGSASCFAPPAPSPPPIGAGTGGLVCVPLPLQGEQNKAQRFGQNAPKPPRCEFNRNPLFYYYFFNFFFCCSHFPSRIRGFPAG